MQTHSQLTPVQGSAAVSQQQNNSGEGIPMADAHPMSALIKDLPQLADHNGHTLQLKKYQSMADQHGSSLLQLPARQVMQPGPAGSAAKRPFTSTQPQVIQGKFLLQNNVEQLSGDVGEEEEDDGKGSAEPTSGQIDLCELLLERGVTDYRAWFKTSIAPKLKEMKVRYGMERFLAVLQHPGKDYTFVIPVTKESNMSTINDIVANWIISKRLSETKSGKIGNIKTVGRSSFSKFVNEDFDKSGLIKQTHLESRQLHLRHFVMGSWFRAIPDLVKEYQLDCDEDEILSLEPGIKKITSILGKKVFGKEFTIEGMGFDEVIGWLSKSLHDLPINLNVGEGPENTLIGFASHKLTNLAFHVLDKKASLEPDLALSTVIHAIKSVGFVDGKVTSDWIKQHTSAIEGLLQGYLMNGVLTPKAGFQFFNEIAYTLGMDFMKYQIGVSESAQGSLQKGVDPLLLFQRALVPVGDRLYSLITQVSKGVVVNVTDMEKLVNSLKEVAGLVELMGEEVEIGKEMLEQKGFLPKKKELLVEEKSDDPIQGFEEIEMSKGDEEKDNGGLQQQGLFNFNPMNTGQMGMNQPSFGGNPFGGMQMGGNFFGGNKNGGNQLGGNSFGGMQLGNQLGQNQLGGNLFGGMQMGGNPFGGMQMGGNPFGGMQTGGNPFGGMQMGGNQLGQNQLGGENQFGGAQFHTEQFDEGENSLHTDFNY